IEGMYRGFGPMDISAQLTDNRIGGFFGGPCGGFAYFEGSRHPIGLKSSDNNQTECEIGNRYVTYLHFAKKLFPPADAVPRLVVIGSCCLFILLYGNVYRG